MAKATSLLSPKGNRLLARLAPAEYLRLLPLLKSLVLEPDQLLHKPRTPFVYAYFPTRAVTSYLRIMESGAAIEVGTVGNEGMVGASGALRAPESPHQVIVQVSGEGYRIEVK